MANKKNTDLKKIAALLGEACSVAVFCHRKPDADSLGSALALSAALKSQGKRCCVFCESEILPKFFILTGAEEISRGEAVGFDLYVAFDCGDILRLGKYADVFLKNKRTVNIDHHPGNDFFAAYNYVTDNASTAEIALSLIEETGFVINDAVANLLTAGILTDTSSFTNSNTDARVLRTASRLLTYRVNINELNFALRKNTSANRLRLLGKALTGLRLFEDGKISLMYVTVDDIARFGCDSSDTEGFVEHAISVGTALIGICITEDIPNRFQVSMRSKNGVDVSAVCASFGGGGHKAASGCAVHGFLEDVIDKLARAASFEIPL